jgi:hypothetical protein
MESDRWDPPISAHVAKIKILLLSWIGPHVSVQLKILKKMLCISSPFSSWPELPAMPVARVLMGAHPPTVGAVGRAPEPLPISGSGADVTGSGRGELWHGKIRAGSGTARSRCSGTARSDAGSGTARSGSSSELEHGRPVRAIEVGAGASTARSGASSSELQAQRSRSGGRPRAPGTVVAVLVLAGKGGELRAWRLGPGRARRRSWS